MTSAAAGRRSATRSGWRSASAGGSCGRRCAAKNACKTCALGMGGQTRRHGQRGGPLSRGLQEVAAGDGRRHAGRHRAGVLRSATRIAQLQTLLAARAGIVRPADRSRSYAGPATRTTAPIAWDEALGRIADQLQAHAARRDLLLLQRPLVERGRLSAAALRPALRHQQRQQLLATTATRPAASA